MVGMEQVDTFSCVWSHGPSILFKKSSNGSGIQCQGLRVMQPTTILLVRKVGPEH
jgi:hypothetical protein